MPPSDSTFANEYGAESVKSKKLLCPKHAFLSLVVKGRFVSTKSFGLNSGKNLDPQLWNFAVGNRASLKIFDLRSRPAVCRQHDQEHGTESRTKCPGTPPAPSAVRVLSTLLHRALPERKQCSPHPVTRPRKRTSPESEFLIAQSGQTTSDTGT